MAWPEKMAKCRRVWRTKTLVWETRLDQAKTEGFNECHARMSSEVKRRASVEEIKKQLERFYVGAGYDNLKNAIAQAIHDHMTEGLE
jgi:hypothetical protein